MKFVGFVGTEIDAPVHIENRGETTEEIEVSTRLWQAASQTKMPLGPATKWRNLRVDAHQAVDATVRVKLPEGQGAMALRLQLLVGAGKPVTELPIVALPRGWFVAQLATQPVPVAFHDPGRLLAPELERTGAKFTRIDEPARVETGVVILVRQDAAGAEAVARDLGRRGLAVVVLSATPAKLPGEPIASTAAHQEPFINGALSDLVLLADSASAQYHFVLLLQRALRAKSVATTPPTHP